MLTAQAPDNEPHIKRNLDKVKNLPTFLEAQVAAQSTLTCDFTIQHLLLTYRFVFFSCIIVSC